jgi:hypothetical protein
MDFAMGNSFILFVGFMYLPQAVFTDAFEIAVDFLDPVPLDLAPPAVGARDIEVDDPAAALAEKMMMGRGQTVVADLGTVDSQGNDQPFGGEQFEGRVQGCLGKGGDGLDQAVMEGFDRGMGSVVLEEAENGGPLIGRLDSLGHEPVFEQCLVCNHYKLDSIQTKRRCQEKKRDQTSTFNKKNKK